MTQQSHSRPWIWKKWNSKIIQKNTCIPMFIEALFTIAKTWKQPKCPLKTIGLRKVMCVLYVCVCIHIHGLSVHTHTHTHTLEYYSAIKRNKIMTFAATWMELESIILSGVRERQILCALTYMLACPLSCSYLCLENIMLYIRAVPSSWMLEWEDMTSRDAANCH